MSLASPMPKAGGIPRRHDLDALRSIAMLLGILLHVITYLPDTGNDAAILETLNRFVVIFIHGFRMPVFFVMSGFFTAMLWRKRGLRSMLVQRFKRIFVPLALAKLLTFSIVRLFLVLAFVFLVPHSLIATVESNDVAALNTQIAEGVDINEGADWRTPLHAAVNAGHHQTAEALLEAGADVHALNFYNQTPLDLARQNQDTAMIALLQDYEPAPSEAAPIDSEEIEVEEDEFLGYLWFLWFLCWYAVGFAIVATIGEWLHWRKLPDKWVITPLHYLWLVPLTMIFQAMGPHLHFGPHMSTAILPAGYVLAYYAIFFGFGAIYFHYNDDKPHRQTWWIEILIACLIYLPVLNASLDETQSGWRLLPLAGQALFSWLMVFGLMKLFRRLFSDESKRMRYISDSSYWLYLVHLPVLYIIQVLLLNVTMHPLVRLIVVCTITVAILLVTYEYWVRYRWIGRLLNGPRYREGQVPPPTTRAVSDAAK